jgi:putative ABC transport system permease protein
MAIIDYDKWQEIFHTLRQNKLRTILTAFGVFWGIFMLIIMLGAGNGLQNGVVSGMGDFATNSMFIWAQPTTIPFKGFSRNRSYYFEYKDMEAIKNKIPEIEIITPTVHAGGWQFNSVVINGLLKDSYVIEGIMPNESKIDPVDIRMGRYINQLDILNTRKVALLGNRVYEELFKRDENAINKYIKINGSFYQVIGVYMSKHSGRWGEHQNSQIFIPFTTTQQIFNYPNKVDHFSIVAAPGSDVALVEKKVKEILRGRHGIHPDDVGAFGCNNVGVEFKKMNGLFLGIRTLIWIVGIGTLLAGVIGVSNIMMIIINERTQEFGIKRALGATPIKIVSTVISESVFLTSFTGAFGLFFGMVIIDLIDKVVGPGNSPDTMFRHPEVDLKVAVTALVLLIFAGILAGLIPSKRAVSIKPIEAIRTEN